jgi:hypothetical protein
MSSINYESAADFLEYKHSIAALRKYLDAIGNAVMVSSSPDFNLIVLKSLNEEISYEDVTFINVPVRCPYPQCNKEEKNTKQDHFNYLLQWRFKFIWIRILIRIQSGSRVLMTKNWREKIQVKIFFIFF